MAEVVALLSSYSIRGPGYYYLRNDARARSARVFCAISESVPALIPFKRSIASVAKKRAKTQLYD